MALLELKGVGKDLGSDERHTEVLRDVNLAIEEGEAVAIVGYSGAGKTTLLSILAGLLHPDVGTATFRGVPIAGPSPALGVVFQSYSLLPWLTVVENVLLAVDAVHPDWSREEKRRCAERFIALVGLSAACDKRPAQLSGGMRQRVAVARALSTEPGVLLMDEPLGALDALTRGSLQSEIERIGRESGKTQVLITNDVDEALLMADRVVPLGAGPRATLGPSFEVPGARPRDARALARDPATKRLRLRI
ncbi:MAG: ABC transporter ATP-binding protein, partial [Deltaproteobacteria bacterium]|nr:ABC transporter ATP-binding protein [Deltaproteobacteria bacterium]